MSDETTMETPGAGPADALEVEAPGEAATPLLDHRKRKRGRRLATTRNLRAAVGARLRELEAVPAESLTFGERIQRARVVIYGVSVLGELARSADLEQRLVQLEDMVRSGGSH